jgi:dihydrofolate reductase
MKVILYAAITVNGMIAKKDGNSNWPSPEDFASFNAICRQSGCPIMGRRTFDIFNTLPFTEWPNTDGLHIVVTSSDSLSTSHPNIRLVKSPKQAIVLAQKLHKDLVVVTGGGQTFGSFLKENLIDEIFIDIEPLAFGEGIPFLSAGDFETKFDLIETKLLSSQTIQLHYCIKK